jgi:diguanylate cyclase (GGDEF)-like protein/PAS domain S-box-containing protein
MCALRKSENDAILAAIVQGSDDAIFSKTLDAVITSWNPGAERIYGYKAEEVIGQSVSILVPADLPHDIYTIMERIKSGERVDHYETVRKHKDGRLIHISLTVSPIRNEQGEIVGASTIARDITARREAERALVRRMSHLANHDILTGLPNRLLLYDRLTQAINAARRQHKKLAVLFADLDDFKIVNDSWGHAVGDALLQSVAKSLVATLRSTDTVSRHGGDEFVILLSEIHDANDAAKTALKVLAAVETAHRIGPHTVQVSVSIGISIYPDHGQDAKVLLQRADAAMYRVKNDRDMKYQFSE